MRIDEPAVQVFWRNPCAHLSLGIHANIRGRPVEIFNEEPAADVRSNCCRIIGLSAPRDFEIDLALKSPLPVKPLDFLPNVFQDDYLVAGCPSDVLDAKY